jgi:hypothetical protein
LALSWTMADVVLDGAQARRWVGQLGAALKALRLNRQFPPWRVMADSLLCMAQQGELSVNASGLPGPRSWVRLRAEQTLAADALNQLAHLSAESLQGEERDRLVRRRALLSDLMGLERLPTRRVQVALRHSEGNRAWYRVVVDRLDLASATLARYTLLVADDAGSRISAGELELRATDAFRGRLELLASQDAALAFAALREAGLEVEEVVRGVVGPAFTQWPGGFSGPEALAGSGLKGPLVSACLERVSLDLEHGRIDDPLARTLTVPGAQVDFGSSWHRKWAVPGPEVPALQLWLKERGSRNLIYGYDE